MNHLTTIYSLTTVKVEANDAVMAEYKIEGLPTLVVFKNGVETARHMGSAPYHILEQFVVDNLTPQDVVSTA